MAILVALVFLALGSAVLRPLNIAWFRGGLLLGAVVTPVVMALLHVPVFMPTSLVLHFMGRNPRRLKQEPDRASYLGHPRRLRARAGHNERQF